MWSFNSEFSPSSWDRINALLDHIYADFTGKAEKDRHISADNMDKIARGRIWSGDDAKRIGLVDENGGYATAIAAIRQLAKLPSHMPVDLVQFPRPKQPLEYLLQMARRGHLPAELEGNLAVGGELARWAAALKGLAGWAEDGELTMPPVQVK
jgi:protease-4